MERLGGDVGDRQRLVGPVLGVLRTDEHRSGQPQAVERRPHRYVGVLVNPSGGAVMVGRPILWGLTVAGEKGALDVLEILRRELDEAMLLCGCTRLSDINRSLLMP